MLHLFVVLFHLLQSGTIPSSFLDSYNLDTLKIKDQLFCRMPLNFG